MSARLDVPTLLRRVQRGAVKGAGDCMCPPVSSGPPYEPCDLCHNVDADTALLARLADAVEALNAADSRHEAAFGTSMEYETGPALTRARWAVIRLLRGEVEP